MKISNFKKLNTGFTLVETMVAISIFTGAVLGLLALTGGSISNTTYAKNKLVAYFLAQEGVEYVRNLRDTYALFEPNGFENFKNLLKANGCNTPTGCYVNPDSLDYSIPSAQAMKSLIITPCSATCPNMFYDEESVLRKYNYTTGEPTGFSRKIKTKDVVNADGLFNKEIQVESIVNFTSGSKNYEVLFVTYLKDWTI